MDKNFSIIVTEILSTGLSQQGLADIAGCSQPSIHRIKLGNQKPNYDLGETLLSLHKKYCRKKRKAS